MAMLEKVLNGRGILSNIGIFASSLLVTVIAVYFYSPVIGSHADEARMSVAATVNPIISLSLDTSLVSFDLTPGDGATFSSLPINAVVDTNSSSGYDLFFSSVDDTTDMTHTGGVAGMTINSVSGSNRLPDDMSVNTWGYSLDGTRYTAIPLASAPANVRTVNQYPTLSERTTAVNIGVKVSRTLPSGSYEKDIVFSAIAHPVIKTIHDIETMQEMTSEICRYTKKPAKTATTIDWKGNRLNDDSYVPRTSLRDTRDGNYYLVSKLADGNCWMSQNLAFDLTADTPFIASNIDGTTIEVTPDSTTQTTTGEDWSQETDVWHSYHPAADERYYQAGITKASTPSESGIEYDWEKTGNYYNWYTATAGTGTSAMTYGDASASICPKGWRIPAYSASNARSFANLIGANTYALSAAALRIDPMNFILSGIYLASSGNITNQGNNGYYWNSIATSYPRATMFLSSRTTISLQQSNDRKNGLQVRCVAI